MLPSAAAETIAFTVEQLCGAMDACVRHGTQIDSGKGVLRASWWTAVSAYLLVAGVPSGSKIAQR
eukprot:8267820-Pyramimonas_sp.AAC.1